MNYTKYFFMALGAFTIVFGTIAHEALGAERFVAVCANNGDGTTTSCAASPGGAGAFNTIQAAVDAAVAGDTITVLDGIYDKGGTLKARVNITKTGTASNPIIIRSLNKQGAKVDGSNNTPEVFFISGNSAYITIDGFEIYNGKHNGFFIRTSTIKGKGDGGGFIRILNNKIHNNGNTIPCDTIYGYGGIFEDAHDVLIKGNEIYGNGRLSCPDGTIHISSPHSSDPNSCCRNHHDQGIYPNGPNLIVEENIIYENASYGITPACFGIAQSPNGSNWIIRNNVIYNEIYRGGIHYSIGDSSSSCKATRQRGLIENNIIYHHTNRPEAHAIHFAYFESLSGPDHVIIVRNNIFYDNETDGIKYIPGEGTILYENNITLAPLFVDVANKDFRLQPSSPGKGAGFGGVDIGAYPQGDVTKPPPDTTPPSRPEGLQAN